MPNTGLDIGSGFLRGFASIMAPHLEQKAHEKAQRQAKQQANLSNALFKKVQSNPELLKDPGTQELFTNMIQGKKFDPEIAAHLLAAPDPNEQAFNSMMFGGGGGRNESAAPTGEATAAPAAAPAAAPSGIPPDTSLTLRMSGGRSITKKGASRLERQDEQVLAARDAILNKGKSLDEATTGMVPEVKTRLATDLAHTLDTELAAQGKNAVERAQAINDAGLGSYLPPGQASLATGRARASESARGRLDVKKEEFNFSDKPDGGASEHPANNGQLPGESFGDFQERRKADAKRAAKDLEPLVGKEAALMVLPDGRSAGEAGIKTRGQAMKAGAIPITRDQMVIRSNLRTSLPMLETMTTAIPQLYPDDTATGQAERTLKYEFQKRRGTNKTLQDLQRVNDSAMHLVRNILNEKGNLRGDVLTNARSNLFHSYETQTSAASKLEFWKSIFASAYAASGAPPPPEAQGTLEGAKVEELYTGGEGAFPGNAATPEAPTAPKTADEFLKLHPEFQ